MNKPLITIGTEIEENVTVKSFRVLRDVDTKEPRIVGINLSNGEFLTKKEVEEALCMS